MGSTPLTEDNSPWFIEERNFLVYTSGLYGIALPNTSRQYKSF